MQRTMREVCFRPGRAYAILGLYAVLASAVPARAEELVTVSGREGATQSFLLMAYPQPKAVALLFAGGEGLLKLHKEGDAVKIGSAGNFLVRTRGLLRDREMAVAIIDAPSDEQRSGMNDGFRAGRAHAADVSAVVRDLRRRFPQAKIFLVGTSRGTVSAAYLGRSLGDAVDGVILTSTLFDGGAQGAGLSDFDFGTIKAPLLFVHHESDRCRFTPYGKAERLGRRFALITVSGGSPARSDPCGAFAAHGYLGKEEETVKAMKAWMLGGPYPKKID